MGFKNNAGLGVNNYYGARDTGGAVGVEGADGSERTIAVNITGTSLNDGFVPPTLLPKGALLRRAFLRVDEAFTMGGTSPTVVIGAKGAEATNGIVLTSAELGAVGSKVPASTGAGTWSSSSSTGTTAASTIGITLGGTSPTVTPGVGKAVLIMEFMNLAKQ